ncbi:hypothetical protein PT974_11101 [Cladobotryum mycophilum]|uniref:Uncharacterized protein n=1 Tax=Cladobotryum mycophilum TaxID=491253 RepID=A0ABR0SBM6_9HYPO
MLCVWCLQQDLLGMATRKRCVTVGIQVPAFRELGNNKPLRFQGLRSECEGHHGPSPECGMATGCQPIFDSALIGLRWFPV